MKNFKILNFLLILAGSLLLVNCTTDPIPGEDGQDGMDGADGASGTAECAACHNVAKSEEVHASYLFSGHFNENMDHQSPEQGNDEYVPLSQYGNRGFAPSGSLSCVSCHTSDGYIDIVETGSTLFGSFTDGGGYPLYDGTQTITCNTCHNKHTSFDFENDGFDYALRVVTPVTLLADASYTLDYGKSGMTNHTCATCHQPRSVFPDPEPDGTIEVDSRFGPHYGAQTTLLEGIHGAEIAGTESYDEPGSARHRSGSSCTQCHMGESTGNIDGLHTTIPTNTTCVVCHQNGVPEEVAGFAEDVKTLEDLLLAEGILKIDDDGDISIVSGYWDLIPAQALWNYRMIYYDHSKGVHNPKYAKALVKNSIEALNGN